MQRRKFLKQTGLALGALGTHTDMAFSRSKQPSPWVGIQISPHAILDEGIDNCLDILQERARVNTLVCYSNAAGKPKCGWKGTGRPEVVNVYLKIPYI